MLNALKRIFRKQKNKDIMHEGEKGIEKLGHREYIGGMWDDIGKLQISFLIKNELKPDHCLLDIACGSLRGGINFINYLDRGNYLGIDKEKKLVEIGIEKELGDSVYKEKSPEFVISDCFEFNRFSKKPQFSIAQSLFTHLNAEDIKLCLRNLRDFVDVGHVFFVTFFEGQAKENPQESHSHAGFSYSKEDMEAFGKETGWVSNYIGDWGHPKNQMMMKYEAR